MHAARDRRESGTVHAFLQYLKSRFGRKWRQIERSWSFHQQKQFSRTYGKEQEQRTSLLTFSRLADNDRISFTSYLDRNWIQHPLRSRNKQPVERHLK
ncbi:hypothetical protein NC652_005574 [Populus alba x Populus x berolinensis]|nr:hypothetical protein NC652_005574 [Populus alba x Populus x berolinensis]